MIPESRSSAGKGIGYPFHYSCDSLVAQLVKSLPAMWETWVRSLGWEDPLEESMSTHSSIFAWSIATDRGKVTCCNGLLWWLSGRNPPADARDTGSTLGLGRYPGEGNGNPLQYSYLGYSPQGHKELDTTERLHLT